MNHVIIGLGNPGGAYAKTRHNAGRMAVERFIAGTGLETPRLKKSAHALVTEGIVGGVPVVVALPEVYMNESGKTAVALVKSVPAAQNLLVVRDDLDMPVGAIKITTYGRGSGGQKGVESIARALKTKDFVQLKIGVGGAKKGGLLSKVLGGDPVVKHVLGKFSPAEKEALDGALVKAVRAMEVFVTEGLEKAMLVANTK